MILITKLRITERLGLGEIILACLIGFMFLYLPSRRDNLNTLAGKYALTLLAYLFVVMMPLTIISTLQGITGSHLTDLLAYGLSFIALVMMVLCRLDLNKIGIYFIYIFSVFILLTSFLDLDFLYYAGTGVRFSAGAKNPNTLALYCISALAILSSVNLGFFRKAFFTLLIIYITYLTESDAAYLSLLAILLTYIFLKISSSNFLLPLLILFFLGAATFIYQNASIIFSYLQILWIYAGDSFRFLLIENGLSAWMKNPAITLLGNGAGSFSGFNNPYEGWEAHSTPVDFLTIGGIFGLILFYFPLFYGFIVNYKYKNLFLCSAIVGLFILSCFHFIGRNPIWWFSLLLVLNISCLVKNQPKEVLK